MPPPLTIRVTGIQPVLDQLDDVARRQIPMATAMAVNDVAFQVMRAERANIERTFAHPRPFTVRSVLVTQRARKEDPTAIVDVRPEVATYLQPYETGGVHHLPGAALLNPKDISLDQYHQLPQNAMLRLRGRSDVFFGEVDTKNGGQIKGVWQKPKVTTNKRGRAKVGRVKRSTLYRPDLGGKLKLLIRFGNALPVHQHLNYAKRAAATAAAAFPAAVSAAIARAVQSRKP